MSRSERKNKYCIVLVLSELPSYISTMTIPEVHFEDESNAENYDLKSKEFSFMNIKQMQTDQRVNVT